MNSTLKNPALLLTIMGVLFVCFFLTAQFSWRGPDKKGYTHVIDSDGKGYYQYLTAVFINHNLGAQLPDERYIFRTKFGSVNKYFSGTAIAMLPFFGAGYLSAIISHKPLNGISPPFQRAISIAGWCYLCIGLIFLACLLMLYDVKIKVICITVIAIVFGTNLLMYAVYHPSFSHIYSFAFVTMFLYYMKSFFTAHNSRSLLIAAAALGMIILIRPTNGIIILIIPFLAGNKENFISAIKDSKLLHFLFSLFILCALLCIQPVLWKIQSNEFFLQSYVNEGFYFSHPQILNVLFSFRKGFFIYTPFALLCLSGIYIAARDRLQLLTLTAFFILMIYITASWWNWYYGPSYGQRPFIEFYSLFALLFAILFSSITKERNQKFLLGLSSVLILFNLVQSFQYVKNIISPWDMNFEKYKYTFLKISPSYYSCLGGCNDITPYPGTKTLLRSVKNDYEHQYSGWTRSKIISEGSENNHVADLKKREFGSACDIVSDSTVLRYRLLFAKIRLDRKEMIAAGKEGALIGIVITDKKKKNYHYHTFAINEIPNKKADEWKTFTYNVELPKVKEYGDVIRFYIWNKNKKEVVIDNFQIALYGIE